MSSQADRSRANEAAVKPVVNVGERAWLIALLAFTTILSQFFRSAVAVIAPELVRDLALTPEALAWTSSGYFLALLVAQPLVGFAFDRFGARRTVATLAIAMTLGAALHATAHDATMMIAARFVVGIGCAASFMSAVVLVSQWFPRASWSTALSWVFGLAQIGILLAGAPLAWMSETYGWRNAFLVSACASAACGLVFFFGIRDAQHVGTERAEDLGVVAGLRAVFATPGVWPVFTLFAVAYAASMTITGLWVGTYLKDVHGLDAFARGRIITAMAVAQTVAVLVYGPLDRVFNSRKWVIFSGSTLTCITLAVFALYPALPTWIASALLIWLAGVAAYGTMLLTHVRSLFPDHLAGRGATTGNMAQLLGTALLPMATGLVPGFVTGAAIPPGTPYPIKAYRWIFAIVAGALAIGLAVYLGSRDTKPRETTPEDGHGGQAQR
jgi:MFS family permease